jgi:hypothetical protein
MPQVVAPHDSLLPLVTGLFGFGRVVSHGLHREIFRTLRSHGVRNLHSIRFLQQVRILPLDLLHK